MEQITKYKEQALSLFTKEDIELLKKFNELEAKVKFLKKQRDESLKNIFVESGESKFENDDIRIIYKKPSRRKSVDIEKLKEEGLYDYYSKVLNVSDSVIVEVKYE